MHEHHRPQRVARGYCHCGCGGKTSLARQTDLRLGYRKGEPVFFIRGHANRKSPVEYIEEDRGYKTPCWIWQRATGPRGHGQVNISGHTAMAHRLYYQRIRGPIPEGMQLDHLCENSSCVNPDHLEPVTQVENVRRGPVAKLTMEKAREIRARAPSMTKAQLAREYEMSRGAIEAILRGWTWREAA